MQLAGRGGVAVAFALGNCRQVKPLAGPASPSARLAALHVQPRCGMQLAGRGVVADTFSLCFGGVEGDGALMLGDVDPGLYGINLAHTALVPSPDHPHYYCLQLEGLAVDGALLPVPAVRLAALWELGWCGEPGEDAGRMPGTVLSVIVDAEAFEGLQHCGSLNGCELVRTEVRMQRVS